MSKTQKEIGIQQDTGCFKRAVERGDQTFTLVGRDRTSPSVICEWIKQNIETCSEEKLIDALKDAIAMRNIRRWAD